MGGLSKLEGAADLVGRLAGQAPDSQYIRAFHGSPLPEHFDKFDASKIGTGEGAQVYGHGHYSAQKQAVADEYRRALSYHRLREDYGRVLPDDAEAEEVMAALQEFDPRQRAFLQELDANDWLGFDYPSQAISQSLRKQEGFSGYDVSESARTARNQLGTGYELEIRHPESSLLDWDRMVGEQPDSVRSAVTRVLGDDGVSGKYAYKELEQSMGSPQAASELLKAVGVPGIRYLDQGSRSVGEGTRNIVMFPGTEDSIRILRKYAVPGAIGAGAASSMQGEQ